MMLYSSPNKTHAIITSVEASADARGPFVVVWLDHGNGKLELSRVEAEALVAELQEVEW